MRAEPAGLEERVALHSLKRVERLRRDRPLEALRRESLYARVPRDFRSCLGGPGARFVVEVRFASPPGGMLHASRRPSEAQAAALAGFFIGAGACAVSIATERHFFGGDVAFVGATRRALPEALLLMRDVVVDEYQLELARAEGADAVALVGAVLGARLPEFAARARALGLTPVEEVEPGQETLAGTTSGALRLEIERFGAGRGELSALEGSGRATLVGDELMAADDPAAAAGRLLR